MNTGPAKVIEGEFEGRITNIDDFDVYAEMAICYFGTLGLHEASGDIPFSELRKVSTDDLWSRCDEIGKQIGIYAKGFLSDHEKLDLLHEYHFIWKTLTSRWEQAQHVASIEQKKTVFISHSSKDKQIATWLSVDLSNRGHNPWLDQWEIKLGESIPEKINEGLGDCDVVLVLLSPKSVESGWVEREWQAKYWQEIEESRIMVIPVLLDECEIPPLLRMKKYADFRNCYSDAVDEISKALIDLK